MKALVLPRELQGNRVVTRLTVVSFGGTFVGGWVAEGLGATYRSGLVTSGADFERCFTCPNAFSLVVTAAGFAPIVVALAVFAIGELFVASGRCACFLGSIFAADEFTVTATGLWAWLSFATDFYTSVGFIGLASALQIAIAGIAAQAQFVEAAHGRTYFTPTAETFFAFCGATARIALFGITTWATGIIYLAALWSISVWIVRIVRSSAWVLVGSSIFVGIVVPITGIFPSAGRKEHEAQKHYHPRHNFLRLQHYSPPFDFTTSHVFTSPYMMAMKRI